MPESGVNPRGGVSWRRIRDVRESVLRQFGSSSGACAHVTALCMTRNPFWTAALNNALHRFGLLPNLVNVVFLARECGVLHALETSCCY